ncbi:DUF1361 domain-containing protein [Staphylococcus kloosii]|jgi:uncharacterized membrane protein|uniref:DUF1361 domain-containing protein n=1 Tax=Staphylococcus kloosii TaxID=29384 RepID=A0A151A6Y6_9STAP|nr:DUF1361 domain-containing protein [Staphylococcus kloosii]AVQ36851.1 DUF1361 domain-containing protein [Staphylococcus kloosii]KYH15148.1 hypothetical protein A0131_10255 [Staphylococcus kloosii]MBF7023554.1 DUF1361 domain-containing protein [Staphylococcus kloosii]MBF7028652.1 DUF1361 domain-containing protein [Staphylococcus kloosii]MCD8877992.1 DUF1361 domain-containing protein [Staphylococcus kloosii]
MNFKYKVRYIARIVFLLLIIISILKNNVYGFMTLNLFLAYIPLELCLLLKLFKPRRKFEWPLFVIFSLIFVFMVPNTFYMITDLIHLNQFAFNFYAGLNIIEWKYFSYLVAAVFFALYCLMLIFLEMSTFTRYMWLNRTIILIMMFLNGLGIYMGRFLRVHSVYLINEPLRIIREVFVAIFNVDTIIFVLLMVCLQLLLVLFMKGVRMAK